MATKSKLFLLETFDLLSCTTIFGAFYGVTFSLYCLCVRPLYLKLQNPEKRRQAGLLLLYISFLFFCVTGVFALSARIIQLAYVNHADYPGGPFAYEISYSPAINPYQVTADILDFIIEVLTMAIQIQRLWIIWSGTRYAVVVIILPVLLLLAFIALDIPANIAINVTSLNVSDGSMIAMEIAAYIISPCFTILVTGLIATRLLLVRRQLTKVMGTSDTAIPYLSIVAILVESYVLESAWSLAVSISEALSNPSYFLFVENDPIVKIIAYFLIVYRAEKGWGWTKQTQEKLSSLRWNHHTQSATDEHSGITRSRVPATTAISVIGLSTINRSGSPA